MSRNVESIFGAVVTAPHQIPYTYTATGGETFISLPFYPVTGFITINGGVQVPVDNYEIDGNTVNLGRALEADDVVYCLFDKILSPEDYENGIRIYKFQAVGNETSFTPDFTTYGVQSLYIDGKFQVPGVDYNYNSATGVVSFLNGSPTAGVWVVAEMSVKQNYLALSSEGGASLVGTTSGSTVQEELNDVAGQLANLEDDLSTLKIAVASVSFTQFGAVGDGVANDTHAVKLAFDYALANNVAVEQHSGVFLLDGTEYIDIRNLQTDLTGCVLKPSASWTGQIVISQTGAPVTYGSSSDVVTKLNTNSPASRAVGSTIMSGIATDSTLDGCYVKISTSQPMFVFRDATYTRKDLNRVYNRGNIENPLRYGLGTNVTEVIALKIRKDVQTVKGLTIDESLSKNYRIVYINNASRVKLVNTSFINAPITQDFSDTRIDIAGSYDVEIDGLFTPSVVDSFNGTGDIYSYSLGISESMNVRVKHMTANGEGWGATGSNNSANITFEECDLSRIDFHMPFQGYLRVNKCNVGRYGVVVTGIGDLIIDDVIFNGSTDQLGSIIATRPDCGGFFDGDLYMSNVTIAGRRSGQISALIQGPADAGQGPASGSPINSTLFNKVVIRDLKLKDGFFEQTFATLLYSQRDSQLLFPKVVDIDGLSFGALPKSSGVGLNIDFSRFKALFSDMTNSEHPVTGRKTTDIILRNIQTPYLSVTAASARHNPSIVASNVRHVISGEVDTLLEINQRGRYLLDSCSLEQLKLFYGSNPNGLVSLTMRGGRLQQPVAATMPISGETTHSVTLDGTDIVCQFNGQDSTYPITKAIIARALVKDCRYWDVSGARLNNLSFVKPESTSTTITVTMKVGQKLAVSTGYTAGNTYTRSNFTALWESGAKQVASIGAAGNVIVTYTVSGDSVSQIVMTSPASNEIRDVSI
ncbi:tail fiber protein [Shigella phage MK-13]|uniref:Uncharacterized protein n=1 Tax=Shigella phage MK-13 TaxID=2530042 RepID=A0A513QBK0_9CAUD|nr:tail fiber protein [Shigella phage MK-13]QBJ04332.1 hypothetical protein MK13_00103 [Shigella phage MK-13]